MKAVMKSLMVLTITLSFAQTAMATAPTCKYAGKSQSSIFSNVGQQRATAQAADKKEDKKTSATKAE